MALIDRSFRERIVLVGVAVPPTTPEEGEAHLDELGALVDTAGADEVERVLQRRESPDPATYVGKGKASELRDLSNTVDADTVTGFGSYRRVLSSDDPDEVRDGRLVVPGLGFAWFAEP